MVLKNCSASMAKPLAHIFLKSLKERKISNGWQLANITPIFKKGHRVERSNYRPVSLTSILSKVLESILRDELIEHLVKNSLISEEQHGFCSKKELCCSRNKIVPILGRAFNN